MWAISLEAHRQQPFRSRNKASGLVAEEFGRLAGAAFLVRLGPRRAKNTAPVNL